MNRLFLFVLAAGAVSGTFLVAQVAPQAPPPAPAQAATPLPAPPAGTVESGYTSLFNGKDLTGWKIGGPAESFSVEGGAIVAHGNASHLYYDGTVRDHVFRNFDLKLDVMARNRSNGGVYVLTEYQERGFPGKGFEIQVNNSHTDRIRSGSLYHVVDLSYIPAKDDEWFPMEISVSGDTITVSVKGNQVVRWTQPPDWNGNYDTPGRKIAPGTIAFQAHDPNSTTAYANIRIRARD
jgi:3-keto-disaccharide hydrolase